MTRTMVFIGFVLGTLVVTPFGFAQWDGVYWGGLALLAHWLGEKFTPLPEGKS